MTIARRKTSKHESCLRFETLNAFVDTGMADLSRPELVVWLVLYRDTKRDGTARASLDDLARRGGMNQQMASRAVGRLARRKMLQVLRRGILRDGPRYLEGRPFELQRFPFFDGVVIIR
jgi:DNA-binding MarR family transcriptional regulator